MGEVRSGDVILGVALVGVSLGVGKGEGGRRGCANAEEIQEKNPRLKVDSDASSTELSLNINGCLYVGRIH